MYTLNVRINYRHSIVENQIRKLDDSAEMSRSAIFRRACAAAVKVENWQEIRAMIADLKPDGNMTMAYNYQGEYDEKTAVELEKISENILRDLSDMESLKKQYLLLLILLSYRKYLETGQKTKSTSSEKPDLPEMMSRITELMINDPESPKLKRICEILKE